MMKEIRELVISGEPGLVSLGLQRLAFYILSADSVGVRRHSALVNLLISYRYPEEWITLKDQNCGDDCNSKKDGDGIQRLIKAIDDLLALGLSVVTTPEGTVPRACKSLLTRLYLLNVRLIVLVLFVFGSDKISMWLDFEGREIFMTTALNTSYNIHIHSYRRRIDRWNHRCISQAGPTLGGLVQRIFCNIRSRLKAQNRDSTFYVLSKLSSPYQYNQHYQKKYWGRWM